MMKPPEKIFEVIPWTPSPFLRAFVADYELLVAPPSLIAAPLPWHIMPDGSAYLIFQWFQRKTATGPVFSSRLVLVGPRSVYTEVNRQHRLLTLLI